MPWRLSRPRRRRRAKGEERERDAPHPHQAMTAQHQDLSPPCRRRPPTERRRRQAKGKNKKGTLPIHIKQWQLNVKILVSQRRLPTERAEHPSLTPTAANPRPWEEKGAGPKPPAATCRGTARHPQQAPQPVGVTPAQQTTQATPACQAMAGDGNHNNPPPAADALAMNTREPTTGESWLFKDPC